MTWVVGWTMGRAILSSSILLVLTTGYGWIISANPHSDEMKQERYRRIDKNTIELRMKIDDPKTFIVWRGVQRAKSAAYTSSSNGDPPCQ